ncbi:MAG: OsmC family peroxiredoxin [Saprospirales bacterium]|nr:MAG: OsmC family peroxiredoxin [Saprospirales bacterium]
MKISEVEYSGELRTRAVHLRSGNAIITDAPVDNQGKGQAFSPTDLLTTSLASCMLTIMGIKARYMNLKIEGSKARVTKIMASDPRRVSEVAIKIQMPKSGFSDRDKKILEQAAMTCPVMLSLHPDIKKDISFEW